MTATWHGTASWVVDEVPTATKLNQQIRDHADFFKLLQKDSGDPTFQYAQYTTANFTKNADTTLADVTGLSFPIGANEIWLFAVLAHFVSSTTADLKTGLTFPTGAVGRHAIATFGTSGNQDSDLIANTLTTIASSADEPLFLHGLVVNASTAGNVQVQAAQNVSHASNTIIYQYSAIFAAQMT